MTTIRTSLWFDDDLEDAMAFWTGLLPDSTVGWVQRYGPENPEREGQVLAAEFTLCGHDLMGINGGPQFAGFTETFSLVLSCADQAEIDRYWAALTADGGEESRCGWCKDRFGLSWQVVPAELPRLLSTPAAVQAMLGMGKLDIAALEAAGAA